MMIVMTAVGVTVIAAAALWFSPLRPVVLRVLPCLNRFKFTCKVQLVADESKSLSEELVFCVQMIGKIPVPRDNMDTNVSVELADITESRFMPDPVLSVNSSYRCGNEAEFHFVARNGIVPNKHAAVFPWKTIVAIPAHQLRFARRGRRKLLVKVSILSAENAAVLVSDQQIIEYVFCSDGFKDLRDRKLDVLKASIQLAAHIAGPGILNNGRTKPLFQSWLNLAAQSFPTAIQLTEWVESLPHEDDADSSQAVDCLLAYAQQADQLAAVELALQVFASAAEMTAAQFCAIAEIANRLEIKQNRFLPLCQKILLFSNCRLQAPALLLGIDSAMGEKTFRSRLNEEYRKWNARVTHPDEQIRSQADRMLSFIADLRSSRTVSGVF